MITAFIYFIGSGLAFFTGAAFLVVGVWIVTLQRKRLAIAGRLLSAIGVVLIAFSAVPLPWWVLGLLAALLIG
jgi:hypothetical protein